MILLYTNVVSEMMKSAASPVVRAWSASRRFIVASRDTAPFQAAGVVVINPWDLGSSPA